jgi:hypothetical protein
MTYDRQMKSIRFDFQMNSCSCDLLTNADSVTWREIQVAKWGSISNAFLTEIITKIKPNYVLQKQGHFTFLGVTNEGYRGY